MGAFGIAENPMRIMELQFVEFMSYKRRAIVNDTMKLFFIIVKLFIKVILCTLRLLFLIF